MLSLFLAFGLSVVLWVLARESGLSVEWWIGGHVAVFVAHVVVLPTFLNYEHAPNDDDSGVWATAVGLIRFFTFVVLLIAY